jgi:hypothetical protein
LTHLDEIAPYPPMNNACIKTGLIQSARDAVRGRIMSRPRFLLLACLGWGVFSAPGTLGEPAKPSENQVKAAYIYNFGKFVKWPTASAANQSGSFTICVLDGDPFGAVLESSLAGESVGSKLVAIKRIPKLQDAIICHILFLNTAEKDHLREILTSLGQASVLTVSDIPDFSKRGGMIQFVLQGDRVRFEINRASAEGSGLILASDLLKVAAVVRETARPGEP